MPVSWKKYNICKKVLKILHWMPALCWAPNLILLSEQPYKGGAILQTRKWCFEKSNKWLKFMQLKMREPVFKHQVFLILAFKLNAGRETTQPSLLSIFLSLSFGISYFRIFGAGAGVQKRSYWKCKYISFTQTYRRIIFRPIEEKWNPEITNK